MDRTLFDDEDVAQGPTPEARRQVRRIVLSGLLQMFRAARGWSTNDAAAAAGIAPMTWRRLEDANSVRRRSLTAVDNILGLELGTVVRALDDDLEMVDLVGRMGMDINQVSPAAAAGFLDQLSERFRTGTVAGAGVAQATAAAAAPWARVQSRRGTAASWPAATDEMRDGLDLLSTHVSSTQPTTLRLATALVERLTSMEQTTEIRAAVRALAMAMPDVIAASTHDACADKGAEQEQQQEAEPA